ncbi:MAG: tetratricopeptide repeat protein [Oscillatoriales cyanobacterium RM2_1_1]|nr:tetratricopeptide repeat protein [Oscillatoriales cyanobacterium RM2_1_1]
MGSKNFSKKDILRKSLFYLQQQAEAYLNQGQLEDARKAAEQILKLQPQQAEAHKLLGDISQRQGQFSQAQQHYQRAIQLNSNWPELHANLGSLYARTQQWQGAIQEFQRAIQLKPDFAGAYRNLAKVWKNLNQPERAAACQRKATELDAATGTAPAETLQAVSSQPAALPAETLAAALHQGQDSQLEFSPRDTLAAATSTSSQANGTVPAISQPIQPILQPQPHPHLQPAPATPQDLIDQANAYCALKNWELAIATCQKALRIQPDLAVAYKIQGNALQMLGEVPAATRAYEKALELNPEYAEVCANLGSLYGQQERLEKAISYYQQALRLKPDFAGAYRNLAKIFTRSGNPEQAVQCIARAHSLEPDRATAAEYLELGQFHLQQSQLAKAAACFEQALKLDPQQAAAHQGMGEIYRQQGEGQNAVAAYEKTLELDPANLESYRGLGQILAQQEKWTEALAVYQKLLELNPNSAWAYQQLGDILQQQWRLPEAETAYQRAIALNSQRVNSQRVNSQVNIPDATPYFGLGKVLAKQERWPEAVNTLQKALALMESQDPEIYKFLGHGLVIGGEIESAIEHYQRAIHLGSQEAEVYQKLGDLLRDREELPEALEAYRQAVTLNPEVWWTHNGLADVLLKLERWQEAISCYRQAIELNSEFAWSYNGLAEALSELERWSEAVEAYNRAIERNPNFPWSHYNLGEIQSRLGNWEEAVRAYRAAWELDPTLVAIEEKLADALRSRAMGDLTESLGYYQQLIQENPDHVTLYHKALEIRPDDAQLYCQLASTLARQHQTDAAIVFYQMAQQLEPEDTEASSELSRILPRQGIAQSSVNSLTLTQKNSTLESSSDVEVDASSQANQRFPIDPAIYEQWMQENCPRPGDLRRMVEIIKLMTYKPLVSIITPVYNTPEKFLKQAIDSVLEQIYPYWELCLADDASTKSWVKPMLEEYASKDSRIKVVFREENGHICAASNSALELATGEFIALLDHDDVLTPEALYEVVLLLNQHPEADMIYSDEDKMDQYGQRIFPYFKPDWCPDSFLSRMYTCHLGVYRRSILNQIGNFRMGFEGSQDYDLVLRFTEQTEKIFHIPKILYSWRQHEDSTAFDPSSKLYAYKAAEKAITEAFLRRGENGKIISDHVNLPGQYTIRYEIEDYKLVSIIIPTRNLGQTLDQCLRSIFEKSTYPNYEVIVIDNGSDEPETLGIFEYWEEKEPERFKYYELDIPFNYPKINNFGVKKASGDFIVLLNNDTEVVTPDWLEAMVEQAQRPSIGAVGALLLYPDDTIQHAGVVLGIGGVAGHSHKGFPAINSGYYNQLTTVNNYSAVTGACLMCRREVYEQVGGLDETLAVAFNDVDFCLKLIKQGYRNICLPYAVLYHYESKSRGYEDTPEKEARFKQESKLMKQRWGELLKNDPVQS